MGIAVPHELSVLVWDDSPLCRLTHPDLTAMSCDVTSLGGHAAQLLTRAVRPGDRDRPPPVPAAAALTPRGSTSRAPS